MEIGLHRLLRKAAKGTDRQRGIEATEAHAATAIGMTDGSFLSQPETGTIMKISNIKTKPPGPKAKAIVDKDQRYTAPAYGRVYPLVVKEGRGMVIEDVDGNLFLDFMAGIAVASTGHSHPKVVKAIEEQACKFLHICGSDFYYEPMAELAHKLTQLAPGTSPKRVFLTNSGTEAIEAAFKLARFATKRQHAIAFYGAFHGRTLGALSLTASRASHRAQFSPLI